MRKLIFLLSFIILVVSCKTTLPEKKSDNREITIVVDNPLYINAFIDGAIEKKIQGKSKNNRINLLSEEGQVSSGFDIYYEMPLSENVSIFCRGGNVRFRENQEFSIPEPQFVNNFGTFIIINNKANNVIDFRTGTIINNILIQKGNVLSNYLESRGRVEFSPGETAVFQVQHDSSRNNNYIRDRQRDIQFNLPQNLNRNYIYKYEYISGSSPILVDIRPLHRAGEPSWAKTLTTATGPMTVISEDGQINLFYPTDKEIKRNTYNSAGNEIASVANGKDKFDIKYAQKTENGFFLTGYNKLSNGSFKPVARIFGENGILVTELDVTSKAGIRSAFFNTVASKDASSWFLSGGGDRIAGQELAYVSYVKNEGNKLSAVWELTGEDFEKAARGSKYADIIASAYNKARDRLLVAGQVINSDAFYVAEISADGKILNINKNFKDREFTKIVATEDGSYYLIGEEFKGDDVFAFVSKHDAAGKQLWRLNDQPNENSYYQDAVLDLENNRIILAGTMNAKETHGLGGTPFIDAISIENGSLLWREELNDSSLKGASLVTAITHAPDYGFAITLSGVSNNYDKPFIIARINSQGKFFKE